MPNRAAHGSGDEVIKEFIKTKIVNGVAVVGLDKFEDMRDAEFITTEELDHVFEFLTTVAVKKQAALDKKEKRFIVRNKKGKKVGDIIDRPEREYQAIVGEPSGFTPIEDLIEDAKTLIDAFWNNALKTTNSKAISSIKAVYDKIIPLAARRVRKKYGVAEDESVRTMLAYMGMNPEVKIAMQFVMERMKEKGV